MLLLWTGLDPELEFGSGPLRERSALWQKLAVLVSSVLRILHRVLVRTLGAGTVDGLWTNELDCDLNL